MSSGSQGLYAFTWRAGNGSDTRQAALSAWRENCGQLVHQKSLEQNRQEDQSNGSAGSRCGSVPKRPIPQHNRMLGNRRGMPFDTWKLFAESDLLDPESELCRAETWNRPRRSTETPGHQLGFNHIVSYENIFIRKAKPNKSSNWQIGFTWPTRRFWNHRLLRCEGQALPWSSGGWIGCWTSIRSHAPKARHQSEVNPRWLTSWRRNLPSRHHRSGRRRVKRPSKWYYELSMTTKNQSPSEKNSSHLYLLLLAAN